MFSECDCNQSFFLARITKKKEDDTYMLPINTKNMHSNACFIENKLKCRYYTRGNKYVH